MPKFIVDLWLDGYETEEEIESACEQFIYEQLNSSASSVKIEKIEEKKFIPKCCICGTTENVRWVGGYQPYLCDSLECIPF
jgi:hypothetical protein